MDTLAEAYYAAGDYEAAVRWENRALEIDPENDFFQGQLKKFEAARGQEK
jgi:tetratricopeptide (TPR) repeat protein